MKLFIEAAVISPRQKGNSCGNRLAFGLCRSPHLEDLLVKLRQAFWLQRNYGQSAELWHKRPRSDYQNISVVFTSNGL